jgi:hypothetical protein
MSDDVDCVTVRQSDNQTVQTAKQSKQAVLDSDGVDCALQPNSADSQTEQTV